MHAMTWMFQAFVFLLKAFDKTKVSVQNLNLQNFVAKGLIKIGFSI
jgi:hypothetical protein